MEENYPLTQRDTFVHTFLQSMKNYYSLVGQIQNALLLKEKK